MAAPSSAREGAGLGRPRVCPGPPLGSSACAPLSRTLRVAGLSSSQPPGLPDERAFPFVTSPATRCEVSGEQPVTARSRHPGGSVLMRVRHGRVSPRDWGAPDGRQPPGCGAGLVPGGRASSAAGARGKRPGGAGYHPQGGGGTGVRPEGRVQGRGKGGPQGCSPGADTPRVVSPCLVTPQCDHPPV